MMSSLREGSLSSGAVASSAKAPVLSLILLMILPSKPSVVETNISQSAGSKASLAEVGLMAPSHERGTFSTLHNP